MSYSQHDWWRQAVVYQIYRKAFQDSGNKGTGDLQALFNASIICNNWASMLYG